MKLYDYYRSSCSYRVRIALNLKQISYEQSTVHLINQGGEQHQNAYLELNPQGLVPTLDDHGHRLNQSLAIIEYLDEINPHPALLPQNPLQRAEVRRIAMMIACDMHPLNNLRVLEQLRTQFQATEEQILVWYHHWLKKGFDAIEKTLANLERKIDVCFGDKVTLADICLIPQVYNAKRFDFSLESYPQICKINDYCLTISAFINASPESYVNEVK